MTDLWITLGPASLDIQPQLFELGVGGARLTFSYGTPELQENRALNLKAAARTHGKHFLTIADLPGEKVRLGEFQGLDSVMAEPRQEFTLVDSYHEDPAATGRLPVPHAKFMESLRVGDRLVVGDGSVELYVVAISGHEVTARADDRGIINQTRGLTLQNGAFVPACLTGNDKKNLAFVAKSGAFDMIAISFASSAKDVADARRILAENGCSMPVIAKIETAPGVDAAAEIADAADMVMAGRGDLALYMPWVELPGLVKRIADAARQTETPWILATQIAEGLENFSFPTRAEICDLARWLDDGCAAVMLSYETVFGRNAAGAIRSTRALLDRWGC